MQFPRLAAGLFLLGLVLDASALTIGRPQGPVWIGRPLDVEIPLSLDGSDTDGSTCVTAEVLQGDGAIPDRRVTTTVEPASGGGQMLHIRSSVAIEEPVVTLNVRAGCDVKTVRNIVLLTDVPNESALPSVAAGASSGFAAVPRAPATPRASNRSANGSGGTAGGAGTAVARRNTAPAPDTVASDAEAPRRPRPPVEPAAAPVRRRPAVVRAPEATPAAATTAAHAPAPAAPAAAADAGRPRLQVEALDPSAATVGSLKSTPELSLPDAPDPARRAAAAALWNAMDPSAAEAQREAQRTKELETTLASLRAQADQNQRTLLEMRTELAEARESRYHNPLVYALFLLLLLALIGLLLLWRMARRAAAPAWWGEAVPVAATAAAGARRTRSGLLEGETDADADDEPAPRRGDPPRVFQPTPFAPLEPDHIDSGMGEPVELPALHPDRVPSRPVNTEELFDVQQQSDFFLSLGQHDQAIAVLREHIAANPGTSALAYLDLLRIFHSLERKEDYDRLAAEFERAFNADVPTFEHFTETGRGLEHYRAALARIEALWPAPGTLALIEELVFRRPGGQEEGGFDLAAYQELLLLYSVAKEVIEPDNVHAVPPNAFADTVSREGPATATAPMEAETPPPKVENGPILPPSLYGEIERDLGDETVLSPDSPLQTAPAALEPQPTPPGAELDLAQFDRTAYETLPAPIEPAKPAEPAADPHLIDFELFDPSTEAEIAPRPVIKKSPG